MDGVSHRCLQTCKFLISWSYISELKAIIFTFISWAGTFSEDDEFDEQRDLDGELPVDSARLCIETDLSDVDVMDSLLAPDRFVVERPSTAS